MTFNNQKTSLVIATYNWPEALELVFMSVLSQTVLPGEIVIADDGSTETTKLLIEKYQKIFNVPVKHFWHPDVGYTKTVILNKAMRGIEKDYIIQIDGDVILHKRFIENHLAWRKRGCWINGSRVLLNDNTSKAAMKDKRIRFTPFSKGITNRLNAVYFPLLRDLFFKKGKLSSNARGCNMSYWTDDFVKVNGFNQDIIGYSREDSELAARFGNNNILKRKIKFSAVQYHIHHKLFSRERGTTNVAIENSTIDSRAKYCLNGLKKLTK